MAVTLQALAAKRGGDLFVPLIFRLALRLEQANWDEALEDAPLAAHALSSAQRLFAALDADELAVTERRRLDRAASLAVALAHA